MKQIENILDRAGSRLELAAECGVEPIAIYRWVKSGSIPSKHLAPILRVAKRNKAGVSAEEICAALDGGGKAGTTINSPSDAPDAGAA